MPNDITLVMPVYNRAALVAESLRGLLQQTHADFRLILVDNASTDDTLSVVRSFQDPRLTVIAHPEHVSTLPSFQRTIALVETPFFAVCSSDDLYEPRWLATLYQLLLAHPRAWFAGCELLSADVHGKKERLASAERYRNALWPAGEPSVVEGPDGYARLRRNCFLAITCGLFRKQAFDELGPLRSHLPMCTDWDFFLRILLSGHSIVGTHEPLAAFRRHSNSTSHALTENLTAFRDMVTVTHWAAREGHALGYLPNEQRDFRKVARYVAHVTAQALAQGRTAYAREVMEFAQSHIEGFSRSPLALALRLAQRLGRAGGYALRACGWVVIRLLSLPYFATI